MVHYMSNKVPMLQEPLMVVAAFYIMFLTVIIYVIYGRTFLLQKIWPWNQNEGDLY